METKPTTLHGQSRAPISGIQAWAEWERHFLEGDTLIAERFGLQPAWVASLRDRNFFYWEHLERRAKAELPRVAASRDASEYLSPSEYLRPSQERRLLMDRAAPDWLGWLLIFGVASLFLFGHLFPEIPVFLKGLLQ